MNTMQDYENVKNISKRAKRKARNGKLFIFFSIIMLIGSVPTTFIALFDNTSDIKTRLILSLFYGITSLLYIWLFIHGRNNIKNSKEALIQINELKDALSNDEEPSINYEDNKLVHTHFIIENPFLTEITLDGKLLKIRSNRLTQRNKEISINLDSIIGIKFQDVSLTPGYLNFETSSHNITDFKTDENTIPFFGDVKPYVLELKEYVEYVINNK